MTPAPTESVQLLVDHKRHEWVLQMRKGDVIFVERLGFHGYEEKQAVERASERLAAHGLLVAWTHVPDPNWPGYTGVVTTLKRKGKSK